MNEGWIKLYRQLAEKQIWLEQPFSKGQAWVDILLMVNHKPGEAVVGNMAIAVQPGQRVTSIKQLSERWGWSRKKTKSFLTLLERAGMLTHKSTTKYTVLTVENWDNFQSDKRHAAHQKNSKRTSTEHQRNINGTQTRMNKNDNNDKEERISSAMSEKAKRAMERRQ